MTASPDDPQCVETKRLRLEPARMAELADIAALHADERVWRHRPEGRHTSVEHTRSKVAVMEHQWTRDGLGYWVARLRQPLAGLPAGACVGVGGCAIEGHGGGWNLYYRFRPESHGHGLATELCQAALRAASSVDAERPVIASLLEENLASKATAERTGLSLQGRGPDRSRANAVRLIYADRTLDADRVVALLG